MGPYLAAWDIIKNLNKLGRGSQNDATNIISLLRPSRKLLIHLFRLFCILYYLIFDSSRRCRTLSKVLTKSRRITSVCPITSMVLARSCIVSRSCVSYYLLFRKPCWASVRIDWLSICLIIVLLTMCSSLAGDGGQRDGSIVIWLISVALLVDWNHIGRFPFIRYDALV